MKKQNNLENINDEDLTKNKQILNNNSNYLYSCTINISAQDYRNIAKYFPKIYWTYVFRGLIINLILTSIITLSLQRFLPVFLFFIIFQIYLLIFYKVKLEDYIEKEYDVALKTHILYSEMQLEFYKDFLIIQTKSFIRKIKYNEIDIVIENESNFYLKDSTKNILVIVKKNQCSKDLIDFIKKTFANCKQDIQKTSKLKTNNIIKKAMLVLFYLTIMSFFLAIFSFSIINQLIPHHFINQTKNMWIFWCFLPIPILSILLGIKYYKLEIACKKNIVVGVIICILFLFFGSLSLIPIHQVDYKYIDTYKNILGLKIPKTGEIVIENWDTCSVDKTECTTINIHYSNENVHELEKSIENNPNWFLSTKMQLPLKLLIPLTFYKDENTYFSIYNKTTNEYNTLPEEIKTYEIYAMKYDKTKKNLVIQKYKYLFK